MAENISISLKRPAMVCEGTLRVRCGSKIKPAMIDVVTGPQKKTRPGHVGAFWTVLGQLDEQLMIVCMKLYRSSAFGCASGLLGSLNPGSPARGSPNNIYGCKLADYSL